MSERVVGAMSLAMRAGRLKLGFDASCREIQKGAASLLVVSADAAGRTKRHIGEAAEAGGVPVLQLAVTSDELSAVFRRRVAVAAVTDAEMAAMIRRAADGSRDTVSGADKKGSVADLAAEGADV